MTGGQSRNPAEPRAVNGEPEADFRRVRVISGLTPKTRNPKPLKPVTR
jgi:hypothetical protein